MSDLTPAEAWALALDQPLGIALTTDDPVLLRQHLYNHKYASGDLRLEEFEITIPEGANEVRIFRSKARAEVRRRETTQDNNTPVRPRR